MVKAKGENEVLRCSFCNKDQNDVAKLIAGPTVFICDECVRICVDIIADDTRFPMRSADGEATPPTALVALLPADPETTTCVMCQVPVSGSLALTIPGRGMLCADCEELVVLAVDNRWPADE